MDNLEIESGESESMSDEELHKLVHDLLKDKNPDVWESHSMAYFGTSSRCIMLSGEIDERMAASICSQILELGQRDLEAPITIHINSPGGNVIDALAIYDTLQMVPNPIITMVVGGAFSAGVLIASAGDLRLVAPNSMYFYHQPVMQVVGVDSMESIASSHEFYKWSQNKISTIIRTRAGMSKKQWDKEFGNKTSKYFDAKEAIQYGIATNILEYTDKPKLEIGEIE